MSTRSRVNSALRAQHMPSHLRHLEGSFKNSRGQNLSYLALFPASSTPLRAVVLYLHGIGDHSRRYFHLYERLCEAGFGVLAYDLLSHGASDSDQHGLRAHSARFQYFVDDTNEFIDVAKSKLYPQLAVPEETKMLLSGMSYGTLVSLHTVLSGKHDFSAVVLVAPALLVEMTAILRVQAVFARPLSKLLPKARIVPGVNGDYLCRDPDYVDDFRADPLTVSEPVTARMGAETLKAMRALEADKRVEEKNSALCKLPMLMMMGSNDKVTSLELAQVFYKRLAAGDKEFKVFDGYFHSLFDDPEREAVFDHLDEWLKSRFPLPEGATVDKIEEEDEDKEEVKDETVVPTEEKRVEPVLPITETTVVEEAKVETDVVVTEELEAASQSDNVSEKQEPVAPSNAATSSEATPATDETSSNAAENNNDKTAETEEATEPTADVSSEAPKASAESTDATPAK